jgi:endonuclease/exonuclease/phosphatase family metal-dependent hydrolase
MMRRVLTYLFGFLLILVLAACVQIMRNSGQMSLPAAQADALRLASYNVHYINALRETGPWSVSDWERRKRPLDLAFKEIGADVIGFQEMETFAGGSASQTNLTLDWLLQNNPDYQAAAIGDPAKFPSTQPILFKRNRLLLLDQGWFFFSNSPDVIYSRTFDGSFPAFASWAAFKDKVSGGSFRVINLHTDFSSRTNRHKSMDLVVQRISPWIASGETVFVIGDFNARHGARTLKIVEEAGVLFPKVEGSTYHLNRGLNLFGAIDHIGIAGNADPVGKPVVLRHKFDGEWPTDHYPVVLDLTLGREN